ncbi:HCP-like protein [Linnemannia elongata AG-77]|uniref:HCP-like protein n=1 Tax=Linnemannia elongata AG-77 TaxID=1314771 RepID=A0A197JQX0_9FUNG|nr:HCP-like protein [Linnemannia elongata AG-77]
MGNVKSQFQAVRPVKENLNSPTITASPIVCIDCHSDPTTGKSVILWDDICVVFTKALYVSHEMKVIPFMLDDKFMRLQPLRIAAMPDVVLDIVVDCPLGHLDTAVQQLRLAPTPKGATFQETHTNNQIHRSPQVHTVNSDKDISPIVDKATLGDARSQVELGDMYRVGDGVEQDFEQAHDWYLKAANQGDPSGQCNLGHLYRLELGVDRDHSIALSWYKKAAAQGDAGGQHYVGLVYYFGLIDVVDYSAAMQWYSMAANQGHARAQRRIGDLYFLGEGVQQDYNKAMEWYIRAADQGLPAARARIGQMYLIGLGVSQDKTIAIDWFSKVVSHKDVDDWSQMAMGYMYLEGIGVPKSESMAFAWFLKATRQGLPDAQYLVGRMYRSGEGVSRDFSKALSWLIKSANHNVAYAQHEIGAMYLQGQGVPKNYLTAKEWFLKAAEFGSEEAKDSQSMVQQLIDEDERAAMATKKNKSTSSKLKFW